jgi:hypothetical protein
MFMPDEPPAPAAPKTYSRQALVEKGMSKGWDRERAEAAADVKLARETNKLLDSAAPGESFSEVARRSGELVPDVYMAPEEVSSMPVFPRQKVELPTTTTPSAPRVESTRFSEPSLRPMSELTPQEIRSIDVAKRAREDAAAAQAYEGATLPSKLFPPVGFALGGPAGAELGVAAGTVAKPLASGVSRLLGRIGSEEPTVTELMLRMPDKPPETYAPAMIPGEQTRAVIARARAPYPLVDDPNPLDATSGYDFMGNIPLTRKAPESVPELAYTVPQTSIPSDLMDLTKERATDFLYSSMAVPVAVSDTLVDIYKGAKEKAGAFGQAVDDYSEFAAKTNKQNVIGPIGKAPTLEQLAKNAASLDFIPTQGIRERATSARMFQQAPTELVPLGNYNLDQTLFDVIDTPEGAVEKGLDKSPGFQMWEKENPVRAQKAREVVAAQKAERAPAALVEQREEVKQRTLDDYFAQRLLPPMERLAEYNLSPEAYEALQILGAGTGMRTEEGAVQLSSDNSAEQARLFLRLSQDNPAKFQAHVERLRR